MAKAQIDDGTEFYFPDGLSDEAIELLVRQHINAAREMAALKQTMKIEIRGLRDELRRQSEETRAAVTAPRELIRDQSGRPQRAVSLYGGGEARQANEQSGSPFEGD